MKCQTCYREIQKDEPVFNAWDDSDMCARCYARTEDAGHDEEPECACVRIDVDLDDARNCPLHGPDSELARRQKRQEADDIWAFYNGGAR